MSKQIAALLVIAALLGLSACGDYEKPKAAICYEAGKFWQASFCGSCGNKGIASIIQINRSIGVLLSTMSWMYFGIAIALCAVNSNTSKKMIEQLGD